MRSRPAPSSTNWTTALACCSWTGSRGRTRYTPERCTGRAARRHVDLPWHGYRVAIMRLTVGTLPPAVYWRRRVLLLAALLIVILTGVYACTGGGNGGGGSGRGGGGQAKS